MIWLKDHWLYLLSALTLILFLASEALAHSKNVRANSIAQAVANALLPVVKGVPVIGPVLVVLSNLEQKAPEVAK